MAKPIPHSINLLLIEKFKREYDELTLNWNALEKKAQLTAAVCGALLSFSAAQVFSSPSTLPPIVKLITILVSIVVALSANYALQALRVRAVSIPAPGDQLLLRTRRIAKRSPPVPMARVVRILSHDELVSWRDACRDLSEANTAKGQDLDLSHLLLQFAGFAIALGFIAAQFDSPRDSEKSGRPNVPVATVRSDGR